MGSLVRRCTPAALALLVALSCTSGTAPTHSVRATPISLAGASGTAPRELFDGHIHYSSDAWDTYSPARAVEILRAAGITRALVSSTPDTGTQRLHALAPDLVVPMLRPYRTRDDMGGWTRDGTVLAYVQSTFRRGVHRGIGEFHIVPGDAATPVLRALVALAVREDLVLHAHADERAIAELARSEPRARILWAHSGLGSSPAAIREVLAAHPNVTAELALRGDVLSGDVIDPGWQALFLRYPDRFLVGTDTWVPSRWEDVVSGHERTQTWLRQLPPEVASAIAYRNAERMFNPPNR